MKVKGKRPNGFEDPAAYEWNRDKEKQLWSIVSKLDNYQDEINWNDLSTTLEAPENFLKRRSYKLSAKHLKLLEQQIERKMKRVHQNLDNQELPIGQFESVLEYTRKGGNDISEGDYVRDQHHSRVEDENTASKAFQHLHTSKLLTRRKLPGEHDKNSKKIGNNGSDSDSDASSSLSISNSALEEALMDRLHL